jgi:hypothetical protein
VAWAPTELFTAAADDDAADDDVCRREQRHTADNSVGAGVRIADSSMAAWFARRHSSALNLYKYTHWP